MPSSGVQTCARSEEHTSELQSHSHLVCRLLLEKKNKLPVTSPRTNSNHAVPSLLPAPLAPLPPQRRSSAPACLRLFPSKPLCFCFFFLKNGAPTEISPFPPPAPFPI